MKPLFERHDWPRIAVYDIEALKWTNVHVLCHVDELGNRKAFIENNETKKPIVGAYLDWLFDKTDIDHVWAHWGGHYDHRFLIAEATRRGWTWEIVQSGNMLIIVTIYHPTQRNRKIHFCESARLMPDSVEKIGKTIGLPKLDADRSHMETMGLWETIRYCFRDCDIVFRGLQYMKKVLTEVGADFAYTLASIASRFVRRSQVLDWKEFVDKKTKHEREDFIEADTWCMPAYAGGWNEVFRKGTFKDLFYYDVRSSYPWSMLGELPAYFKGFRPPPKRSHYWFAKPGVSEATVNVPSNTYLPILPFKKDGKLLFPVGTMRGRWTHLELVEAMKRGYGVTVHAQCEFEPMPFLKPFVETFYELRKKAIENQDEFASYAFKILLNAVYGKLEEMVERQNVIFGVDAVNRAIHKGHQVFETPVPGVYTTRSESRGGFRHVAAGAYITARSRLLLAEYMETVLRMGGRIYYCDTDSIVCDVRLPPTPDALGNLKLEDEIAEIEIVAPKVYRLVSKITGKTFYKVKGTPVDRQDGKKLTDDKARARWNDYLAGVPVSREGLMGFTSDIRKGTVDPHPVMLSRAMRSVSRKRVHELGDSRPVQIDDQVAEMLADFEKAEAKKAEVA